MLSGLKFIRDDGNGYFEDVKADDASDYPFDDEDKFLENARDYYAVNGYKCYYFGGGEDGAMRTGKTSLTFDGENTNFYFEKSGGSKGAGVTGEKDDKLYQSGMLLKADSDDKYIVVEKKTQTIDGEKVTTYTKLDDANKFLEATGVNFVNTYKVAVDGNKGDNYDVSIGNGTKKLKDLSEAYTVTYDKTVDGVEYRYILVNTSGKVINSTTKSKDGSDYYYVTKKQSNGENAIVGVYVED